MASINSVAVGEGRRSVGEFTYKYVNGETIASKRIVKNRSNTYAQQQQRQGFTEIQSLLNEIDPIIRIGYTKTGRRSVRNNFLSANTNYSAYLRKEAVFDTHETPVFNLYNALKDPRFTNPKVYAAQGGKSIACLCAWDEKNLPVVKIQNSYPFIPGDTVTVAFAFSYEAGLLHYEGTRIFSKTLTTEDVGQLTEPTTFVANNQTMPGLSPLANTHAEATDIRILVAPIVHTSHVTAPSGNATSYFVCMPPQPIVYKADTQAFEKDGQYTMRITSATSEAFPAVLAQNAVGAILDFQTQGQPQTYNVIAIALDSQQRPIGLILRDPHGYQLAAEPLGAEAGRVSLTKAGQLIAYIEGLRIPALLP